MFGLPYTIFRPHNVYGERQNIADKYRNVVGIFMNAGLRDEPMPVFGDGLQQRAFSHIADVAPLIARSPMVPASENETFNIGADDPSTVLSLAHVVADVLGIEPRIEHKQARNEVVHAFSDHSKIRDALDPPPSVPLDEGLRRMWEWVQQRGPQQPTEFAAGIEVERNLPPSWRRAES
jgi:UDP-glucose 4-epimerase